jgi:hypothetical protein
VVRVARGRSGSQARPPTLARHAALPRVNPSPQRPACAAAVKRRRRPRAGAPHRAAPVRVYASRFYPRPFHRISRLSAFNFQLSAFLFLPSLRAAPPACAGHAVRLARPAGAPHSDGGKPPTRCFRMLTPLRSFHPSATVTGWALRICIRENSTAVFRLRTFGPGLRPNTGGCPWHASVRRNTASAHALIARRANHPASFPLPNSHGRKRPKIRVRRLARPHTPQMRARRLAPRTLPAGQGKGAAPASREYAIHPAQSGTLRSNPKSNPTVTAASENVKVSRRNP